MRARTFALLSLVIGLLLLVGPTSAFNLTSFSRDASAAIVTDANGYNAIHVPSCDKLDNIGGTCTFTITNKATTAQFYNVSEDPDSVEVTRYKIDASAWQTTGRIMSPDPVSVGGTSTVTLDFAICIACGQRSAYYTVEGEKANSLNSMQTKVIVTISYT